MLALRSVFEPNVGLPTPPAGLLLLVSFHCPPQGHMEVNPGFSCGSLEIKARGRRKTGAGYQGVRGRSTAGSSLLRAADFPIYGTVPARPPPAAAMWTLVVSVVASPGPGPLSCCACTWLVRSQGTIVLWSWKGASWGRWPPSSGPTKGRLKDSGLELCRGAPESLIQLSPQDGLG